MIKIEEKELNNIKNTIIKYLKKNKTTNNYKLIEIIELALNTYKNEIIKHNNNNNITK